MATEAEKRLHRCCFFGQHLEKQDAHETIIKKWLEDKIDQAIANGYVTFMIGCERGLDIWAGQIIIRKKKDNPALHLIAAQPWPEFSHYWDVSWCQELNVILQKADLVIAVSKQYHPEVFQEWKKYLVNHCNRIIAYYCGNPGELETIIDYASRQGKQVVVPELLVEGTCL